MVIHEQSPTWIPTAHGNAIDLADPNPWAIAIEDIAVQLARVCRWSNATREHYSVAQHSVLVSQLVPAELALAGLLHDAAEAYLGDASVPLKVLCPEIVEVERRVAAAIARAFDLDPAAFEAPEVIHADHVLRATERRDLVARIDMPFLDMPAPLAGVIEPWSMETAAALFLKRFAEVI